MKKTAFILRALLVSGMLVLHGNCDTPEDQQAVPGKLFEGFADPPAEARPFVRWWWNGNRVTDDEISRQLDVLHLAGIGGIEINPIAMPPGATDVGAEPKVWLSDEWNDLLVTTAREAQQRGMIADMIVGSGWPFGGEFLETDETVQRVIVHELSYEGPVSISIREEELTGMAVEAQSRGHGEKPISNAIFFVSAISEEAEDMAQVQDLTPLVQDGLLTADLPADVQKIRYGFLQKGHREVVHGAKGAAGPVMDHYKREVTLAYLSRLKKISEDTGVALSDIIRALFCDSIELAGANWTDGFADIFFKTYGYRLEPYFPFVFYDAHKGYSDTPFEGAAADRITRVRYDYNKLLVRVFLDNFTRAFQQFCTENGLQARYQAYGTPFLMGMMEGNMIPDIPESNNWIYTADMDAEQWNWNQSHGYMIWNLYAASGGHLTGRKIISCEAMTNTRGVFKASLEEIKQHDDMNFITGINHSVLHGYNYSPEEAGFPGWVRYGAYFSEQNTWWPYFHRWVDYNARLSYVFQNTAPVKKIAIVGPTADLWGEQGLVREPFHTEPWYCYRMWEAISQAGSSCDYISEEIIGKAQVKNGRLQYGPMQYEAVVFNAVRSIQPETAKRLMEFVGQGGNLVFVDAVPDRSPAMKNAETDDRMVREIMQDLREVHKTRVHYLDGPKDASVLLPWTENMLSSTGIERDVEIAEPLDYVYQIHKRFGDNDLYFFVNSHRTAVAVLDCTFPAEGKTLWRWDPHTGSRSVYASASPGEAVRLVLQPLESALLVFDDATQEGEIRIREIPPHVHGDRTISAPWTLHFKSKSGEEFDREVNDLQLFGTSGDEQLRSFGGTVTYATAFEAEGNEQWLEIEQVRKGVAEVFLNDVSLGVHWYGRPVFSLGSALKKGNNELEIRYTSVLSNYCKNLVDSPTAQRWTNGYEQMSLGLAGRVFVY
jgi:hypothetical protein